MIAEAPNFNGSDFFPETAVLQERKETIEAKLSARKEQLELQGVPVSFSIETGNDIVGSLMRVIQREHADMVVISTHGVSGWRPLMLGSIAEQVIKQVRCTLVLLQAVRHGNSAEELANDAGKDSFVPRADAMQHGASGELVAETVAERRLDRVADDMAGRSGRTEQNYDESHLLLTK